jgi:DNA topoisomerase-1
MKNLVIVEASGKVDSLKRELKGIGLFADVIATVGHIADNPKSLVPIALDEDLRETSYRFREDRDALLEKIRRQAIGADRIFVATDDDEEGDVIAYDVSRLLADHSDRLFRVRLRAITAPELSAAFTGELSQHFEPLARHGIARRVVDRAIGAVFTEVAGKDTVPVGRVQSSLLASIERDAPVAGQYTLEVRVAEGAVFRAQVPIHSAPELAAYERAAARLAAGEGKVLGYVDVEEPRSTPWGYEQVVAEVSERLRMSIHDSAALFQEAYEKGKVSYPRVRTGVFTRDAVEVAAALARHNRCGFSASALTTRDTADEPTAAHEAPRVYEGELMLGRPLNVLDPTEAVAVLIARNMVECGQLERVRKLGVEVEGMELSLHHWQSGARRNWKQKDSERGYQPYSRELAILRYMGEQDLGRPSTVMGHVSRILQRGLVEDTGVAISLNARGERWLARAREVGFTAGTSHEMERAIAQPMRDPYARAREVLEAQGMLGAVRSFASTASALAPGQTPEPADIEPI